MRIIKAILGSGEVRILVKAFCNILILALLSTSVISALITLWLFFITGDFLESLNIAVAMLNKSLEPIFRSCLAWSSLTFAWALGLRDWLNNREKSKSNINPKTL